MKSICYLIIISNDKCLYTVQYQCGYGNVNIYMAHEFINDKSNLLNLEYHLYRLITVL